MVFVSIPNVAVVNGMLWYVLLHNGCVVRGVFTILQGSLRHWIRRTQLVHKQL